MSRGKKFEWIPWYPQAWLSDSHVRGMPIAARGLYFDLLMHQAISGPLPSDLKKLARIVGETFEDFSALWPDLAGRFEPDPGDPTRLRNAKLAEILDFQERRRRLQAEAGSRGGKKRVENLKRPFKGALSEAQANGEVEINELESIKLDVDVKLDSSKDFVLTANEIRLLEDGPSDVEPPLLVLAEPSVPPANGAETNGKSGRAPAQARLPLGRDRDLRAYAILSAAWEMVRAAHGDAIPMSERAWRQRNKAAALQLDETGRTPENVANALRCAYEHPLAVERGYGLITSLSTLMEKWVQLRAIASGSVKPLGSSARESQGAERRAVRRGVLSDV